MKLEIDFNIRKKRPDEGQGHTENDKIMSLSQQNIVLCHYGVL